MDPGLGNVAHVQLTDLECDECGRRFDHRIDGDEIGMLNDWTVQAITRLECPHCGFTVEWIVEEELRRGAPPRT